MVDTSSLQSYIPKCRNRWQVIAVITVWSFSTEILIPASPGKWRIFMKFLARTSFWVGIPNKFTIIFVIFTQIWEKLLGWHSSERGLVEFNMACLIWKLNSPNLKTFFDYKELTMLKSCFYTRRKLQAAKEIRCKDFWAEEKIFLKIKRYYYFRGVRVSLWLLKSFSRRKSCKLCVWHFQVSRLLSFSVPLAWAITVLFPQSSSIVSSITPLLQQFWHLTAPITNLLRHWNQSTSIKLF